MKENSSGRSWKNTVDENLKRLHSHLFGADLALQRGDFASAQILSLRLLGFLDSHTQTPVDEAFILPIRREAVLKLDRARRSLAPESDRQSFELAKRDTSCPFVKREAFDIERIKQSKYYYALLHNDKENSTDRPGMEMKQKHGHRVSPTAYASPQNENHSTGSMRGYGVRPGGISSRGARGNFMPPIRSNAANSGNNISSRVSERNLIISSLFFLCFILKCGH